MNLYTEKVKIHRVQNAAISETGTTSLVVTWEPPKGEVTGYLLTCQTAASAAAGTPREKKSKKKKKKEKDDDEEEDDGEEDEEEKEAKGEEGIRKIEIDDPERMKAVFEDLMSDEEYVIKIYTLLEDRKSDRVKLTGKTGK